MDRLKQDDSNSTLHHQHHQQQDSQQQHFHQLLMVMLTALQLHPATASTTQSGYSCWHAADAGSGIHPPFTPLLLPSCPLPLHGFALPRCTAKAHTL
jgi:hypothetical protein